MNNYLEYETILKNQIGASIFAIIMIVALSIALVIINIKVFSKDLGKLGKLLVNVFIIVIILCGAFTFISRIYNINQDIKLQSYVTYYGEFSVIEDRRGYVTLKDQGEKITLSGTCDLPGGEYVGTIIYSKSSKHLLDWGINYN